MAGDVRKYRNHNSIETLIPKMFMVVYDDQKSVPQQIYFMANTVNEATEWIVKVKENITYIQRSVSGHTNPGSAKSNKSENSAKVHWDGVSDINSNESRVYVVNHAKGKWQSG